MDDIRASRAQTIGGGDRPLFDAARDRNKVEAFVDGQAQMAEFARQVVETALAEGKFQLRLSLLTRMHKIGYSFIDLQAGQFRSNNVFVSHSSFTPPAAGDVVELLDEMCEYINNNWRYNNTIHLSAFFMWRFLWIHPFLEGNGSIARAVSYSMLQIGYKSIFQSETNCFEFISNHRDRYYKSLSTADKNWDGGQVNVESLEDFLREMLETQLARARTQQ